LQEDKDPPENVQNLINLLLTKIIIFLSLILRNMLKKYHI
jgi:hypothetical protein